MKRYLTSTEAATDIAWETACAANEAFKEWRDSRGQLAYLGLVASREMKSAQFHSAPESELKASRERSKANFELLTSMAAHAMTAPNSIFSQVNRVEPEAYEPSSRESEVSADLLLRSINDLHNFLEECGLEQLFTRLRNAIFRHSRLITLDNLTDYSKYTNNASKLILLKTGASDELDAWFDPQNLKSQVRLWQEDPEQKPDGIGGQSLELLVEYIHESFSLPDSEEPTTTLMNTTRKIVREAPKELPLSDVLCDTVRLKKQNIRVVTHRSIQRFAATQGYHPSETVALAHFFSNLSSFIMPYKQEASELTLPHRYSKELILADVYAYHNAVTSTNVIKTWGIDPRFFIEFITAANQSFTLQKQIGAYPVKGKKIINEYVQTLEAWLDAGSPKA